MYRYHLIIEYEGSNFIGWQTQKKGNSVQKTIQNTISKLLKKKIKLIGAGRTDTGVHAIEQSAHFDTDIEIIDKKKLLNSLNFFLNKKLISINSLQKKGMNFHSRYSAKFRIYKYVIFNRESSPTIFKDRGWHIKKKLDIKILEKGAKLLEGKKDFSTFRSSKCSAKSPIRKINYVKVKKNKKVIEIKFKSKSFLHQQVRSMVGCLKYLGEKKWDYNKFKSVLNSKKRILCAPPAPSHGLFLEKIIY
tara:strand:- start:3212 stop:3952 length:741 start_codon:yes stop_codon:yes gene_type:complete